MFNDNGQAFQNAAFKHLHSAMALFATAMETMEPEKLLRVAEHLEKGARWATREVSSGEGEPPGLELCLYHPEAGWLVLQTVTLSVGQCH